MRKTISVPFFWNEIKFETPQYREEYNRLKAEIFLKKAKVLKQGNNPKAIGITNKSFNGLFNLIRGIAKNKFDEFKDDKNFQQYLLDKGINDPTIVNITFDVSNKDKIVVLYHFNVKRDIFIKFDNPKGLETMVDDVFFYIYNFSDPYIETYYLNDVWFLVIKNVSDVRFGELVSNTEDRREEWGNPYFKGKLTEFFHM